MERWKGSTKINERDRRRDGKEARKSMKEIDGEMERKHENQ